MSLMVPAFITPLKMLSILACILIAVGLTQRRRRSVHIPLMLTAFLIDMGIVAYIEFNRGAIAAAKAKWGALMVVHIIISVLVLVLYVVQIVSGIRKARGSAAHWHKLTGISFAVLRFGNLVTSFLVT